MRGYASRCLEVAALCLGLFVALTFSGHSKFAFMVALIGTAALLSSLREVIHNRENRP